MEIRKRNSPDIVFLMETKNPDEKVLEDLQDLRMDSYHIVSPHSPGGGGLYLGWKKDINLIVQSSSHNFIDTYITYKGSSFQATLTYGEPDHTKRQAIWNQLSTLHTDPERAWFLTGDFNEIIDNSENNGGPDRAEGTFCAFRSFLSENGLFDLKHHGSFLSWRGQRHTHLVRCRLDRSMSNSEWTELFPSCRSQYLRFEGSDHRPLISFLDTTRRKGRKIFRYDRRLKENEEVKVLIQATRNAHHDLSVERKLSLCRKAICKWSKKHHENSKKEIEEIREQLDIAMSTQTHEEGRIDELNSKLLLAYKAEEEFWKQRSRQLWLSLGDANTGYFHAITKGRKARNRLSGLEDDDGLPVFEEEKISE